MIIIIFCQIYYYVLFELLDGINCRHNLICFFSHKPLDLKERGLKRCWWQWKRSNETIRQNPDGANGSWWFPTGKKHQELIVPDGFGKKTSRDNGSWWFLMEESGTKRHHQEICPWFHWFFSLLEPMGDLLLGPMGGPIRGPVEETLRKKPSETSRDHYKKPLGKSHQKPLGTIRPLGNWDTIRAPLGDH